MIKRPFIFDPLQLRSGIRYRNLKNHFFSSEEKKWVCRDLIANNDISTSTLSWNSTRFLYYQDNYFISKEVLYDWVDIYICDEPLIAGRPNITCPVDDIGIQIIEDAIFGNRHLGPTIEFDNLISKVLEQQTRRTFEQRTFFKSRS